MNKIDLFLDKACHPLLQHRTVAKEVVFLIRSYDRILPFHIQNLLKMIGMPSSIEAAADFARVLMTDGWLQFSEKPFTGRGMSAVNAYELTEKSFNIKYCSS